MEYHTYITLSDSQYFSEINQSEENVIEKIVIPFINGQVTEADNSYGESRSTLINMKAAVSLSVYCTEEKIEISDFISNGQISNKFTENDCTHQFVERVREIQASPAIKSLLQLTFQPPERQIFIIMKFGDKLLDSAYDGVIKPLCGKYGYLAVRVDEIQDSGKINDQILENIAKSAIIISDLSGERPNCYYETGFAHAIGKDIILTIHKNSDIHFDLGSNRFIQWETESELRTALTTRLESMIRK